MPVFDNSALMAVLDGEGNGEDVAVLLDEHRGNCFVHALNLAELFYQVSRRNDVLEARAAVEGFLTRGLIERTDLDAAFREDVAQLKADWRKISLADCCGVALARRLGEEFVTSDHHELDVLAAANVCNFHFFR